MGLRPAGQDTGWTLLPQEHMVVRWWGSLRQTRGSQRAGQLPCCSLLTEPLLRGQSRGWAPAPCSGGVSCRSCPCRLYPIQPGLFRSSAPCPTSVRLSVRWFLRVSRLICVQAPTVLGAFGVCSVLLQRVPVRACCHCAFLVSVLSVGLHCFHIPPGH